MKKIELLAPVSSFEAIKAVISAGADAVYLGGQRFGARAYANNLTNEEMIEAIEYAHLHRVKIYLTVNTLLTNYEIESELYDYILPYYKAGIDAVIVQDMGVLEYLNVHFPDLEKHASTQMTLVTSSCRELMTKYNVTRLVPARELNNDEIKKIIDNTGLEVEVFIHGALCYCYSGQCLMSSMIGDRSGNRGRCAQPCRKQYDLYRDDKKVVSDKYLLSTKDLCGLDDLPYLIQMGVASLKIEGRMKKKEYAVCIVSIYRKYIDLYYELGYEGYIQYIKSNIAEYIIDKKNMMDVYNRGGYTEGYFHQHNAQSIMSIDIPSHYGVLVGKVIKVTNKQCYILLNDDINAQDVLQIRDNNNIKDNTMYEFTVKESYKSRSTLVTNYSRNCRLYNGQEVYRIKNNSLLNKLTNDYIDNNKKVPIDIYVNIRKYRPIKVGISLYGDHFEYEYSIPELAQNRPITQDNVIKQFKKLSNTMFEARKIEVSVDDGLFITIKALNDIRRNAIERVGQEFQLKYRKDSYVDKDIWENTIMIDKKNISSIDATSLNILVPNMKILDTVLEYKNINRIYLEIDEESPKNVKKAISEIIKSGISVCIAMPRILREEYIQKFIKEYSFIFTDDNIDGYLVRNIESIELVKEKSNNTKEIVLDYNMFSYNNYSKKVWKEYGINTITTSVELTKDEISDMDNSDAELVIYSKYAVMLSAGCIKQTIGMCNKKCETLTLKDKYNEKYSIKTVCKYCYNIIFNSKPINIINDVKSEPISKYYRIDFIDEDEKMIRKVLESISIDKCESEYKGHYNRTTL